MYQAGAAVFHEEYGWGRFEGVFGTTVRIARVEFQDRGVRYVTLPSSRLKSIRERSSELRRDVPIASGI